MEVSWASAVPWEVARWWTLGSRAQRASLYDRHSLWMGIEHAPQTKSASFSFLWLQNTTNSIRWLLRLWCFVHYLCYCWHLLLVDETVPCQPLLYWPQIPYTAAAFGLPDVSRQTRKPKMLNFLTKVLNRDPGMPWHLKAGFMISLVTNEG